MRSTGAGLEGNSGLGGDEGEPSLAAPMHGRIPAIVRNSRSNVRTRAWIQIASLGRKNKDRSKYTNAGFSDLNDDGKGDFILFASGDDGA
jgi:hypothetical protein